MYRLSPDSIVHSKTLNRNLRKRARSSLELISPKRHQGIAMPQIYTNEELWRLVLQEHGQAWRPDLGRPPRNRTFPIEANHPLLVGPGPKWETLRLKLLEILHKSNVEWSSISVLRRRPTIQPIYDDDTTVVVVIGQDTTSSAENHLYQGLHSTCGDEGHPALRIELLRGKAILFTDVPGPSYQRKPDIGSSLGVRDNNCSAGTLGGFVKLGKNGNVLSCALTCHHVLKPARPDNADSTQRSTALTPLLSSEIGEAIEVDQPVLMDHLELRSTLSDQVEVCEKQTKAITYKLNNGYDPEDVQPLLELLRKKHQAYADHKRLIESADRRFGRVWETSGYLVTPEGFLLDWGVFLVNEDRVGLNWLPPLGENLNRAYGAAKSAIKRLSEVTCIDKIAPLTIGQIVVKFGRSTGTTVGVVSGIKTDACIPGSPAQTSEYTVVGMGGRTFANEGDSGAWVVQADGTLVGMVLAACLDSGVTYVTPIEAVFKDIKAQTGREVLL